MKKYVPSVPDWFKPRKSAQVTAFFALKAGGTINILKATKLVYLADRLSLEKRDFPITMDTYVSMKFGPANSYTYNCMNRELSSGQDEWSQFISPRDNYALSTTRHFTVDELDELSRNDIRILEDVWSRFSDIDRFDLAEWTHRYCPEWTDPGKSSTPISLESILKALQKEDPAMLAKELLNERALIASFRAP